MDEVTTVAMAYAVAGYAIDPLHISDSGSPASLAGIENAFANANNLANTYYGYPNQTIPSSTNVRVPYITINTLADADASCINQTAGSNNCSTFFAAAPVSGNGLAPTDTATAIINIAHNPVSSTSPYIQKGTNIASIISLAGQYQQYGPILPLPPAPPPNDLTLGLTFTSSNFGYPTALAIDGSGNAWIASQQFSPSLPNGSVVEIASPTAMFANNVTYPVDYTPQTEEPESIAVDAASQNIWIGTDNAVEVFSTTTGIPASGSPFLNTDPNFGGGYGLNLDTAGNVWIAAYSSVYELSATGSVLSPSVSLCGSGYCLPAGESAVPSGIAVDASNNVWVTDYNNSALVEFNPQGTITPNPDLIPTDFSDPNGVAIDANGSKWVANFGSNDFTRYAPTVTPPVMYSLAVAPLPPSSPTLTFVGIDGAGNTWLSLQDAACSSTSTCLGVAEVSGAGTPLSGPGYTMDGNQPPLQNPTANATAIDGSGNVWILNKYAQTVTELIGAAAPVVTPLALGVSSNSLGVRP
jgi:streptogramin lyase